MQNEIKTSALGDLCEQVVDCPHSTPKWTKKGVVVLRSSNIKNGCLDLSSPSFTDELNYEYRSRRAKVQSGDLVITREAPMGEVCLISKDLKCCLGQRMVLLRPLLEKCDGKYLLYALQSKEVQHEIRSYDGTGSTVSNLRIPALKNLSIPTPPLPDQKVIAHILGTLDEKIELNRKNNQTYEGIAKGLFKSWFIDFDPVRAKAEGLSTRLPDEINELFPNKFENTELGEIPKGWEYVQLEDLVKYSGRGISPKYTDEVKYPVINQKCIRNSEIDFSLCKFTQYKKNMETKFLTKFDVLVNSMGVGTLGRVSLFVNFSKEILVDGCVTFVRGKTENHSLYLFQNLSLREEEIINLSTGSTGQTSLRKEAFMKLSILNPSDQLLELYTSFVGDLYIKKQKNRIQNNFLRSIRDSLLSKLISGELRIPDAEKMLEEVGI